MPWVYLLLSLVPTFFRGSIQSFQLRPDLSKLFIGLYLRIVSFFCLFFAPLVLSTLYHADALM